MVSAVVHEKMQYRSYQPNYHWNEYSVNNSLNYLPEISCKEKPWWNCIHEWKCFCSSQTRRVTASLEHRIFTSYTIIYCCVAVTPNSLISFLDLYHIPKFVEVMLYMPTLLLERNPDYHLWLSIIFALYHLLAGKPPETGINSIAAYKFHLHFICRKLKNK